FLQAEDGIRDRNVTGVQTCALPDLYLLQSAQLCRALGGQRIIFHPGSCGKQSRAAALDKALDTLRRGVEALDEAGYGDMTLCPRSEERRVGRGRRVPRRDEDRVDDV